MTRSLPEWIGKTNDSTVPPRVKVRVAEKQDGKCVVCTRSFGPKLPVEADHRVSLILGGEHRESNLQAICPECHKAKTAAEVKTKSKIAKANADRLGVSKRKSQFGNARGGKYKTRLTSDGPRTVLR